MRQKTLLIAVLALLIPATTHAGNRPHPTLDAVATQVAGKPVSTWCETSWSEWQTLSANAQVRFGSGGFTYFSQPVVYVSPDHCATLHYALASGAQEVGAYWLAGALLTLAHEAVHQRGVTDEQATDCAALPLVGQIARQHFGVQATVVQQQPRTVTRTVVRKVRGVRVRIKVKDTKMVRVNVPNPFLERVDAWADSWHLAFGPPC